MLRGSTPRVYELWFLSFLSRFTRERRKLCLVAERPNQGQAELRSLMEAGKLVPVIDRVFRLSEVAAALRYFGKGRHKGKIVIEIASG